MIWSNVIVAVCARAARNTFTLWWWWRWWLQSSVFYCWHWFWKVFVINLMISHILLHPSVCSGQEVICFVGNLCTENSTLSLDTPEECCQQQPDVLTSYAFLPVENCIPCLGLFTCMYNCVLEVLNDNSYIFNYFIQLYIRILEMISVTFLIIAFLHNGLFQN